MTHQSISHVHSKARRRLGALVITLGMALSACTPAEIEQTIGVLEQGFEEAGLEGALDAGAFVAPQVIMTIGYRLGGLGLP